MSDVLSTIGKVAGIASIIPGPQQVFLAAIAVTATQLAAIIGPEKPPPQVSSTDILIGADMPSAHVLGRGYSGGSRGHQVGYGEEGDIPNAHAWLVDVYSRGNKRSAAPECYADFNLIAFTGTAADGNAEGFYHNRMHRAYQLGETPEAAAMMPHWSGAPDWGTDYKLSGVAAVGWSLAKAEGDEQFNGGVPQFGTVQAPPYGYDPRLDDDYPGGAGAHRWADPSDKVAFAAAKATWEGDTPTRCPGIQGLNYALGHWQRDETDTDADYVLAFGAGGEWDSIVVEDFVSLANICDANGWNCDGVIYEPEDGAFWGNLKNIVAAGGAEPVIKGGRLGLRIRSPRVAIDTITVDDLAEGEIASAAALEWESRINTIQTKFKSEAHRWEYVPGAVVSSSALVTADGRRKATTVQYNCVTDADQAAQLGGLDLADAREGMLELTVKHRLRGVNPGEVVSFDSAMKTLLGQTVSDWEVRRRQFDPATMTVRLTLVSETPGKYDFAMAQTGVSPPDITIWSPSEVDGLLAMDGELLTFDGDTLTWG